MCQNLANCTFLSLQSESEFSLTPAFSTVASPEAAQRHQKHFALYDVKQLGVLEIISHHLGLIVILLKLVFYL